MSKLALQPETSPQLKLMEGELSSQFPLSVLFAVKKSVPVFLLLLFMIGLVVFGGESIRIRISNMRASLGMQGPVVYYVGYAVLVCMLAYWYLYLWLFRFGVKEGMFYMRKGVVAAQTFDYPITSIENIGIKRDFLDWVFGLCTIQIMTAHEASDDLAAIRGLPNSTGVKLHNHLRDVVQQYQSSRFDIRQLQQEVQSVRERNSAKEDSEGADSE